MPQRGNLQSQSRRQARRSNQQQPQQPTPRRASNSRRRGLVLPAAGGVGPRVGDGRGDEGGPAHLVDHGGGVDVVEVERLALVRGGGGVDGHGPREAGVAGREAARGERDAQGQVVDVAVRRGGPVGDGGGEAVVLVVLPRVRVAPRRRGVLQARGVVRDVVGEEAGVGLADLRVLGAVVLLAGGGGAQGEGEGGHEGRAGGEEDGAGGVEDGGDGGEGAAGVEEGHGVLGSGRLGFWGEKICERKKRRGGFWRKEGLTWRRRLNGTQEMKVSLLTMERRKVGQLG